MFMLERFLSRIKTNAGNPAEGPVIIAVFGDSVTQGCMEYNVTDYSGVYHNILKQKLEHEYPQTVFSVINAGVGGSSASSSLFRLERDVLRYSPDLLLLGFCLNDSCAGLEKLDEYEQNIRKIINETRSKTNAEIIILTPNFMASRETSRIAPEHRRHIQTILDRQNSGILKAYVQRLRLTAHDLNVPVADVYAEWENMAKQGFDTNEFLINGLNHPDTERQKLIANTIFSLIKN